MSSLDERLRIAVIRRFDEDKENERIAFISDFDQKLQKERNILIEQLNGGWQVHIQKVEFEAKSNTTKIEDDSSISNSTLIDLEELVDSVQPRKLKRRRVLSTSESDTDLNKNASDTSSSNTVSSEEAAKENDNMKKTPNIEFESCNKSDKITKRETARCGTDHFSNEEMFDAFKGNFTSDNRDVGLKSSDSDISIKFSNKPKRKKYQRFTRSQKQLKALSSSSDSSDSDSSENEGSRISDISGIDQESLDDKPTENVAQLTKNGKLMSAAVGHSNRLTQTKSTLLRKRKRALKSFRFNNSSLLSVNKSELIEGIEGSFKETITTTFDKEESKSTDESTDSGSKNIRRVLTEKELLKASRIAQQKEKERIQRIESKGVNMASKLHSTNRLVLELDKDRNPLIEVDQRISKDLKKHQVEGIKFLWDCLIESVETLNDSDGSGCILAHSMGLGKSLQVIAFLHTLLSNDLTNKRVKKCIVACPKNTTRNWANEFKLWLTSRGLKNVNVFEVQDCKNTEDKYDKIESWFNTGGVLIIGMYTYINLVNGGRNIAKNKTNSFRQYLADPGPDIIIFDEGHLLKNNKTQINEAFSKVRTMRRAILTGTPLQNNLHEYYVMMNFVKPGLLGSDKEFSNRFVGPITKGQHSDSTLDDVKLMKKRVYILHKLSDGCVQRYDYRELVPYLEPKFEYTIYVRLSDLQIKLYKHYLDNFTSRDGKNLFKDHQVFICIWNHPCALFSLKQLKKLKNDDQLCSSLSDSDNSEDVNSNGSEQQTTNLKSNNENELKRKESGSLWYNDFISDSDITKVELSGKMVILFSIIKECELVNDKLVVFSQSCIFLDLLEECLFNENTDVSKWIKGIDYLRIDGKVQSDRRKKSIDKFNNPNNSKCRLLLVATKSGSLGINLYAANRCVIFDICWNPTNDSQAVCRLYRMGQKKPVFVYRLVAQGTMEEKIYEKQIIKQSLSSRVIDEQQIVRHFSQKDVQEMYKFFPDTNRETPASDLPNDSILGYLLKNHRQEIAKYCEHDSFLENKPEEDLTEDERKAAWDEWEKEKDYDTIDKEVEELQRRSRLLNRFHKKQAMQTQNETMKKPLQKSSQNSSFRSSTVTSEQNTQSQPFSQLSEETSTSKNQTPVEQIPETSLYPADLSENNQNLEDGKPATVHQSTKIGFNFGILSSIWQMLFKN